VTCRDEYQANTRLSSLTPPPPFFLLAGVLFPGTLLLALFFMQKGTQFYSHFRTFIIGWITVYAILTVIALCR